MTYNAQGRPDGSLVGMKQVSITRAGHYCSTCGRVYPRGANVKMIENKFHEQSLLCPECAHILEPVTFTHEADEVKYTEPGAGS